MKQISNRTSCFEKRTYRTVIFCWWNVKPHRASW